MKAIKIFGWVLVVAIILFGFFGLIGSIVVSYKETGQPPGDPPPLSTQIIEQVYREMGEVPSGAEFQKISQMIEAGEITNKGSTY